MLTTKSLARTAAATAGLALVVAGAASPAGAAEVAGADRGQDRAAAQSEPRRTAAAEKRGSVAKGRSADAPHGKAYGRSAAERSSAERPSAQPEDQGSSDARTDARTEARTEASNQGLGDERGDGHTPVTVCHATGNGEFVEVTFDENAFDKHVENHMKHMDGHQDYVVEEGAGCEEVDTTTATGTTIATGTTSTDLLTETGTATLTEEAPDAQVLGVEAFAARTGAGVEAPAVLGAEALAAGAPGAPATGPLAGILPQTGAAPMALAATAGLGLLGAGATVLRRRRREV